MYKIAVVGDKDSVYGFGALGLSTFEIALDDNAAEKFKKVVDSSFAIIYITEGLAAFLEKEIEKYSDHSIPAIIPIPGVTGNTGQGLLNVKKAVEKAVGSDIIFGD